MTGPETVEEHEGETRIKNPSWMTVIRYIVKSTVIKTEVRHQLYLAIHWMEVRGMMPEQLLYYDGSHQLFILFWEPKWSIYIMVDPHKAPNLCVSRTRRDRYTYPEVEAFESGEDLARAVYTFTHHPDMILR